jgi:hypothetical protein
MALRFSRHTGPINSVSRSLLARVNSSLYLSLRTRRIGLLSLSQRPISGLQMPFACQRSMKQKLYQRYRCYSSKQSAPITDPSRPELFYHILSPPTPISPSLPAYGLSFISTPPPSVDSSTIIGWLPAVSQDEGQEASLNDFKENCESRLQRR